ncbi:3-hydroxyacyl-CoA dehydrogenase family protein [Pseudonocardiaceae bacterium YIM PH 21723]|nr:3-hydroxyacyl-CoA dehydrogenase family protein [Pseudonocardiaceae bacterium YIM PH 21723]
MGVAVVVGGGTMGAGIAHVLLVAGGPVIVAESTADRAATAIETVAGTLARSAKKNPDIVPEKLLQNLSTVDALVDLPSDAELIIEAVPEDLSLKRRIFGELAANCPNAVLASNTSSLSLGSIAEGLPGHRILGMHFFNPVPVQELCEIVLHDGTSPQTLAKARQWAELMGKTVIEVRDTPGFATSRLGVAVGLEAIRMLEDGVASAEDIDTGMRLGYRWPMGPLRLGDLVGLDVRLAIAEHLARELGPRFEPPQLLRDKVAAGHLGKKTGQGFFTWE